MPLNPVACRDHNELLLTLYRLSQESALDRFQDDALALLKGVLPFDAAMWGAAQTAPQGMQVHTLHLHQKSPDMMADYEDLKHCDTAAIGMYELSRCTRSFHAPSWFHRREDRAYLDYLRRYEQNNFFISMERNADTQLTHWVTLFRADPDAHCDEAQSRLLFDLTPHLMQALSMNRVLHSLRLDAAYAQERSTAIADLHGVIYHADARFLAQMRTECPGWTSHRLPGRLLAHVLRGQGAYKGASMVLSHRVEHGLLFLKGRQRRAADGLAPRELLVAQLLAKGRTHKEIAALLQRSPATVRNQIRAVYDKLEVGNVAGLLEALQGAD